MVLTGWRPVGADGLAPGSAQFDSRLVPRTAAEEGLEAARPVSRRSPRPPPGRLATGPGLGMFHHTRLPAPCSTHAVLHVLARAGFGLLARRPEFEAPPGLVPRADARCVPDHLNKADSLRFVAGAHHSSHRARQGCRLPLTRKTRIRTLVCVALAACAPSARGTLGPLLDAQDSDTGQARLRADGLIEQ